MDYAVHVDIEVVAFEAGGVGGGEVEGEADGGGVGGEVDALFEDVLDYFGIFFGQPSVECWDSHFYC